MTQVVRNATEDARWRAQGWHPDAPDGYIPPVPSPVPYQGSSVDLSAYATTTALRTALDAKADRVHSHSEYATKVELEQAATGSVDLTGYVTTTELSNGLSAKVNAATYTAGMASKANTADLDAYALKSELPEPYDDTAIADRVADLETAPPPRYILVEDKATGTLAIAPGGN